MKILNSKLLFFLLYFTLTPYFLSCNKDQKDVVPDTFVNVTININNFPIGVTQSIILTNTLAGVPNLGYDNNGLIIYRNDQDEFYAYDRTCTYHIENSTAVNIKNNLFAICPVCSSVYQLNLSGFPSQDSPANYPLKQYQTYYNPNTMDLNISNF